MEANFTVFSSAFSSSATDLFTPDVGGDQNKAKREENVGLPVDTETLWELWFWETVMCIFHIIFWDYILSAWNKSLITCRPVKYSYPAISHSYNRALDCFSLSDHPLRLIYSPSYCILLYVTAYIWCYEDERWSRELSAIEGLIERKEVGVGSHGKIVLQYGKTELWLCINESAFISALYWNL